MTDEESERLKTYWGDIYATMIVDFLNDLKIPPANRKMAIHRTAKLMIDVLKGSEPPRQKPRRLPPQLRVVK